MKREQFEELTEKDKEYNQFKLIRETTLNSRSVRNNVQVFFWVSAVGAALFILSTVLNNVR